MKSQAEPGDGTRPATGSATGAEGVRLGVLDGYVAFHLQLAQSAAFHSFKRQTGIARLRAGWFTVLSLIADNPGITPVAISRASGRDKSTITPVLQDLIRDALVVRERIPNDRRSFGLRITDAGRSALAHLAASAAAHDAAIVAIVGDRREALLEALRRIVAELG
jgi:DNA-binding MarR family transcriptional regulator